MCILFLVFAAFILRCNRADTVLPDGFSPAEYVNPLIGTDEMGHTFPGVCVPFGLVQLSPDTGDPPYSVDGRYNPEVYRYCAGYQHSDKTIVGFSHTHFSGTGHSDLGDIRLMPIAGKLLLVPGDKDHPEGGYRSRFSHDTETARPGYYAVQLEDDGIGVELTASQRVGFHRYIFPETDRARVILDLTSGIYNYDGKVVWSSLRVESDTLITGYRQTTGWAREHTLYFAIAFSRPVTSYGLQNDETPVYRGFWRKWDEDRNFPERAGRRIKAHFDFDARDRKPVLVKVALSGVSTRNALDNMQTEIPGWDFDAVRDRASDQWNRELSKITIQADRETMTSFYTSLYHAFIHPVVFSDCNGDYRGLDGNVHQADGWTNYAIFSLWDTYRALHPLFTIVQQKRTSDIIRSMLAHYDQSVHHILPVWSHHANENWCMIGYHAVPVIVDAWMKGIRGYDENKALDAVLSSANYDPYDGIGAYKQLGFVPENVSRSSASKTLEYAYDDWTIYKFAKAMGKSDIADQFRTRATSYRNLFDHKSGFIHARSSDGSWIEPFDPLSTSQTGYIEGNAWNYSLYVPHDVRGFVDLLEGTDKLETWLDSLFVMAVSDDKIAHTEDVTRVGMIGNYVHGNEPSHHVPYLYCYIGKPWKTQEKIHQIVKTMYRAAPDGLCGNDDCGQMSAWYIFSCLGFYPVAPGSNQYVIGSPCVDRASIQLESGKQFTIEARNLNKENIYIQSVELNGSPVDRCFITHAEIMKGGHLVFEMGSEPNRDRATGLDCTPYSLSDK